jgi:hypothetical protein
MKGHEVRLEYGLIVDVLGDMLVFSIRAVASCPREFNMSLVCSFHTDVRTTMIDMHRLNRDGQGVRSPAGSLTQGLSPSQLSWHYANLYSTPIRPCEYR